MKAQKLGIVVGLTSALLGCGAKFDLPTEIKTLRIIGVQKDKPYAQPGDSVTLTMLWHDGTKSGEAMPPRKVQITWLGGCLNPPGDSYQGCFAQYAAAFPDGVAAGAPSGMPSSGSAPSGMGSPGMGPPGQIKFGLGSTFTVRIPTDAEYGAPVMHANQDPRLPMYGLSYVFFAVCAGEVVKGDEHFPLHCQDPTTHQDLGPDDFVIGYSSIYFFAPSAKTGEPYLNANPETDGFYFGPQEVTGASCSSGFDSGNFAGSCLGSCDDSGECTNQPPAELDCTEYPSLCIKACKDDGDPQKCPANNLHLDFKNVKFEQDDISNDAYGTNYGEQMWIDYYSTRGDFHSSTKLLNDATSGYNSANGTQFYAPSTPGPVQLWAVMHDNRGGVSWVGTTIMVQ